jgi:superfamily II DNA or RNA helicase
MSISLNKRDELQLQFANDFINKGFYGLMYIAPRFGKIKTTINCLTTKDKVIIAYPEVNIKKSWVDDIKKWKFKNKKVKYSTYRSFDKLSENCDVLILDEVHLISENQLKSIKKYIVKYNIKKVIGLSGTLSEKTIQDLDKYLGLKVLVEYSIDSAIKDGVITDYKIDVYYTKLSTKKNILVKWKGGEFYTSEKASFDNLSKKIDGFTTIDNFTRNKIKSIRLMRMNIIKKSQAKIDLTKSLLSKHKGKRVLTFSGLTEVADNLGIPSYHSGSKDDSTKDRFINGVISHLSIVNKLNTGITFPKLNLAIINFFDSNAENMAQKISRVTCMEYDNLDKVAHIIIVCTDEPVETKWLNSALTFFDKTKITHHK